VLCLLIAALIIRHFFPTGRPAPDHPPETGLIASAGFNDARGMNCNPVLGSPYLLDTPNHEGGAAEPGWAGPWPAHPDAVFQTGVVFEGDGALYLKGRPNLGPNYGRQLAQAQTGEFDVEFHLQVPAGSSCVGYVWQHPRGADFSGPNWTVRDGMFRACTLDARGARATLDTDFKYVPGRWYKVTLRIDVPKHTWQFFVDDRPFVVAQPLRFRGKVPYLDYINFLVEGGVYIDALRVTRVSDTENKR
jgi:hypothetical protein